MASSFSFSERSEYPLKVRLHGPKKQLRNGSWFSRSAFVRHRSSGRSTKERKDTIHMDNKQDKGFTLVELLIVIVILGILATVTVFAVRGITDQGQTIGLRRPRSAPSRRPSRRTTPRTGTD